MASYTLLDECPVPWNEFQEAQLHHDYPFVGHDDTEENFVIRNYLENLWLPESITSLESLITTLRHFQSSLPTTSNTTTTIHPMHQLLDTVVLRSRDASEKYRTELVQILADGGGAGELEESMMWFAWHYEKLPSSDDSNLSEEQEERWKRRWLDRLEQKETKIQILLYMLKLSLPGPCPPYDAVEDEDAVAHQDGDQEGIPGAGANPSSSSSSPKKRKKKKSKKSKGPPPESAEERLESFMDKLSMWQLTATIDAWASGVSSAGGGGGGGGDSNGGVASGSGGASSSVTNNAKPTNSKDERHWTQVFCEDVVEPLFKAQLPEQCSLLRSKLFPTSPFSDAGGEFSDLEDAPNGAGDKARSRTNSRAPSTTSVQRRQARSLRGISPQPSDGGGARSAARSRAGSINPGDDDDEDDDHYADDADDSQMQQQQRSRSRSLSVSLLQDQESQKQRMLEPKRGKQLSREISMSRLLKTKEKADGAAGGIQRVTSRTMSTKSIESQAVTLVAATPVKRPKTMSVTSMPARSEEQHWPPRMTSSPTSLTMVQDTPEKNKNANARRNNKPSMDIALSSGGSPLTPVPETPSHHAKNGLMARSSSKLRRPKDETMVQDEWMDENADESFTSSFGSPDVLLIDEEEDDDRSGSPELGSPEFFSSARRSRAQPFELESPTKKRKLGALKFKSIVKSTERPLSPEL